MNFRGSIRPVLAAALLLTVAGCSKRAPAPKPAAEVSKPAAKPAPATTAPATPKPAAKKPKPKPAPAPEPEPEPRPEILFSLRGPEAGRLANDRSLFVGVRVESSVEKDNALTLAPASGRWSDTVSVELSAGGSPDKILLRAQRVDGTDDTAAATLGTGLAAEGTWLFPSAEIAKLLSGDYQVQVKLAITDGAGWRGNAAGEPVAFTLVAAAASATPESEAGRALALAGEAMAAQDWPKAAQVLDEPLAADPDNIELLKTRALVCLQGGNPLGANVCVNRAWARVQRENWTHPPADLYVLSQTVMAAMLKPPPADAAKEPLPAWSMPPASVLEPLGEPQSPAAK